MSSPYLRCLQTSAYIINALHEEIKTEQKLQIEVREELSEV